MSDNGLKGRRVSRIYKDKRNQMPIHMPRFFICDCNFDMSVGGEGFMCFSKVRDN